MSYEGTPAMVGGDPSGGGGGGIQLSSTQITYALIITVGTLLLLTVFLFISIVCLRRHYLLSIGNGAVNANMMMFGGGGVGVGGGGGGGGVGMGTAALEACPKMSYRWDKLFRTRSEAERRGCCAICLSDYCHDRDCDRDRECVRVIPDCGHVFHADCVDEWLLAHATCPVCRASPLPDHAGLGLGDVVSGSA